MLVCPSGVAVAGVLTEPRPELRFQRLMVSQTPTPARRPTGSKPNSRSILRFVLHHAPVAAFPSSLVGKFQTHCGRRYKACWQIFGTRVWLLLPCRVLTHREQERRADTVLSGEAGGAEEPHSVPAGSAGAAGGGAGRRTCSVSRSDATETRFCSLVSSPVRKASSTFWSAGSLKSRIQ